MSKTPDIIQQEGTLNRYLLCFLGCEKINADVLSFTGIEALSQPYKYTLRFTCADKNIPPQSVLHQPAQFYMRTPNPDAKWNGQQRWNLIRQTNGVITSFSRLSASADEALYECVMEHELVLLDRYFRSAVYLDFNVPDLVKKLMKDSGIFEGYQIDFELLSRSYPHRDIIIQWKETDLQFIRRLLSEIGIWFRFENHEKIPTEVVTLFGDSDRRYIFSDKQIPCVHHSGQTSHEDYVTDLQETHNLVPGKVLTRNYHYSEALSPQAEKAIYNPDSPDAIMTGHEYHYADHHLEYGDFYGTEAETATWYARLRHETLLNNQHLLSGTTNDASLIPGVVFYPVGDIPDGFKFGFIITSMEVSGSRGEHYRAALKGIPYFAKIYDFRPERLPRPVISGTVPARVASMRVPYADLDMNGRYRVKFDFDLEERKKGYESALVRLARPYAGDVYGVHFPLLKGTEVSIAFEGGDPDRPFIAHVMHDGSHADVVTGRNETRNVIRTAGLNKIRLEDKRDSEHIKISTEYGKSQVSIGHLVGRQGEPRGKGFEGRTDHRMALRAAKGIMVTTEPQPQAQGKQLDMTAAIAELEKALSLAATLQQCAATAGVSAVDTTQQQKLTQGLNQLREPGLLTYAGAGQAHVTPSGLQLCAGQNVMVTAGNDASLSVVKKFSLAVGEKLSLFARKLGITLIAGAGNVDVQAQRGEIHLLARQDFTLSSTDGLLNISAQKGIQLTCGGGGIRINQDGSVVAFSPTGIDLKAPNFAYKGGESVATLIPAFDKSAFKRRFRLHAPDDPEQILSNRKFRLKNAAGEVLEGETDGDGHSSLLDATDLESYVMELL